MPSTSRVREDHLRRLAATVPALLSVRVETATETTSRTLGQAIEQVAEGLLHWHDALVGGPCDRSPLLDGIDSSGGFGARHDQAPDPAELAAAAYELRRHSFGLQSVVDGVDDEALRLEGQALTDVLRVLAELIQTHVDQLRLLLPGGTAATDTRAARLSVAERVLHRKVLDTLRA